MTEYKTESEVEELICKKLLTAGIKSDVTPFSDTQDINTTIRNVVFKCSIAVSGSSTIIDTVSTIGYDTDRGVSYKGSQVEATNQGEIRYLYFEAKINPNKDI